MDIVQWIGFFISVLAILYLMIRQGRDVAERNRDPEAYRRRESEEARRMREMLKTLDIDLEEEEEEEEEFKLEEPVRKAPPKVARKPVRQQVVVHPSPVQETRTHIPRVKLLLKRTHSPQDMIVLREVVGPPKAARRIFHHESWN